MRRLKIAKYFTHKIPAKEKS